MALETTTSGSVTVGLAVNPATGAIFCGTLDGTVYAMKSDEGKLTYARVSCKLELGKEGEMQQNVTLRVDRAVLSRARRKALAENRSLNSVVDVWLRQYVGDPSGVEEYRRIMGSLTHVRARRKFTREEMNER